MHGYFHALNDLSIYNFDEWKLNSLAYISPLFPYFFFYPLQVLRLFTYVGSWGVINLIMEIIFLVFTIYFLYFEIKRIRVLGFKKYINNFWNMVEFSTLFLCVFCIVCYVMKQGLVRLSMSSLEESGSSKLWNMIHNLHYYKVHGHNKGTNTKYTNYKFVCLYEL